MIVRKVLGLAAAVAAVAAAAGVCVVAASYAAFALARVWLGPAGAAAVVAAIFALVAVVVAAVAVGKTASKPPSKGEEPMADRLMGFAKEHPMAAAAAGVVAAATFVTVAVRNPGLLTAIVSAFVAGTATKPPK